MRSLAIALALLIGCADAADVAVQTDAPAKPAATAADADASADEAAPEEPAPVADREVAEEEDPVAIPMPTSTSWEGNYDWSEGAGNYSYGYHLILDDATPDNPDQHYGQLSIAGTQVSIYYDVLGTATEPGVLEVELVGYREENTNTLSKPGDRLFTLKWEDAGDLGDEVGDKILRTYWGTVTPTGAGDASPGDASTIAFYPSGQ